VEAIGPVLIVLSLPLLLRLVPRNRIYGFRVPPTLADDSVWYDANALCARHMILLGLLMVALEFVLPRGVMVPVLQVVGIAGLAGITALDWRTAKRWLAERKTPKSVVRNQELRVPNS
jgi:uncharacterized membrane protein